MNKTFLIILILTFSVNIKAQDSLFLSLDKALEIAEKSSLDAFRNKNMYQASYWAFRSYRASRLPVLDLNFRPVDFRRTTVKRYDSQQDIDIFREQQSFESYANLSFSQNIPLTGARVYIDSDLSRLINVGDNDLTTYSATWARIGVVQPILGYNRFKWEKKIEPLKFEKAKKEYVQNMQNTKLKVVNLYFELLLAKTRKEIALANRAAADTLYKIGQKKFKILSIPQEELLDLELAKFNAEIEAVKAAQDEEKANFNLNSFLGLDKNTVIVAQVPEISYELQINIDSALFAAQQNNPEILQIQQKRIEADRDLDKAVKENRFKMDLTASFGLNQYGEAIQDAYTNPLNQQIILFGVKIPLLDWGDRKGKKLMAEKDREVIYIEQEQKLKDFEQNILLKVMDFNLQAKLVQSALKANQIAQKSYNLTQKRFLLGKADVLKITNSMKARQNAHEKYVNSIYTYWKYYYEIQKITLYDFADNQTIKINLTD
jgi:outer membrane protein TolC